MDTSISIDDLTVPSATMPSLMKDHVLLFTERRIGELLVSKSFVTEKTVNDALEVQRERGGRLGEILVGQRSITEQQLLETLGQQLGFTFREKIQHQAISDELINRVPINFAKQFKVIPLERKDNGDVLIAASDPLAIAALDDLAVLLDAPLVVQLATSLVIVEAINFSYDRGTAHAAAAMEEMGDDDLAGFAHDVEEAIDLLDSEDEAPIIKLVNSLISQSVKEHASDIHIEPTEKDISVRFRIDGILYEKIRPPKKLHAPITS
ncbi:MAG: hypothetical protein H7Z43_00460, partial [Clostridia bacterium]|nr:hypothetical protein [Deltaproteobacteria bacterium]